MIENSTPIEAAHAVAVQLRGELHAVADRFGVMDADELRAKFSDLAEVANNLSEQLRQAIEAEINNKGTNQ